VFGKNAIAIVKQVFVSLFEPDGLAQLLQRPSGTWMGGDVAMDQAPAAMFFWPRSSVSSTDCAEGYRIDLVTRLSAQFVASVWTG
jgi:hypothetical protein